MQKPADPTDMHVGNMVRMRRLMLGLSQTKLAEGLGVSFQQLQKYEKGTNRISASRLQKIADLLKVPVAFFFPELPQSVRSARRPATPSIPRETTAFLTTREGIRFVKAYTRIKRRYIRETIVRLIEDLANSRRS